MLVMVYLVQVISDYALSYIYETFIISYYCLIDKNKNENSGLQKTSFSTPVFRQSILWYDALRLSIRVFVCPSVNFIRKNAKWIFKNWIPSFAH